MDPSTAKVEPREPEIQSDPQLQRVPEKAGLCEMLSQESKQASKQANKILLLELGVLVSTVSLTREDHLTPKV